MRKFENSNKRLYLLGIGGVSMSALAIFLKEFGFAVRGSDETESDGTNLLKKHGICVDFDVNEKEIACADAVVFSSAIKQTDERMILAKKHKKPLFSRGQILGFVASKYEKVIAVSGSHGKTTTTALIFEILQHAGQEPTLHLGGYRLADQQNFVLGKNKFFVTEACEYHNNFLYLHPHVGVVTNVEKEHMDFFKTFSNQLASFKKFESQCEIVVDEKSLKNLHAKNVRHDAHGNLCFQIVDNKKCISVHTHLCEDVNTQNCLYAYAVAKILGVDDCVIKQALERYQGVKTRFQKMRSPTFPVVIFDYAHHPTEISKAIFTAKKIFRKKKLVTIFQPHTFSRTKSLLPQFLEVFQNLPCPLFFKTYSAREKECEGISAETFCEILQKRNKNAKYFENVQELLSYLQNFDRNQVALLFLGAGDLPNLLHKNGFVT